MFSGIVQTKSEGHEFSKTDSGIKLKITSKESFYLNIKKGDRIAAYMPNIPETVEAFLGTVAIGAIWSSCSPDFGINGVIERFSQIKPKILIVTNQYFYNGKKINILERIPEIIKKIPSIKHVIISIYPGQLNLKKLPKFRNIKTHYWSNIIQESFSKFKFHKFDFLSV